MDAELIRAWRRGAIALSVPAACLLALALACLIAAAWREFGDGRAPGVITDLNLTHNRGSMPTIEYSVGGRTYEIRTGGLYSADTFAVGQQVTVLYPLHRPELGILDAFRELWPFPIFISLFSLGLAALAWKARTGLPPALHAIAGIALAIVGAVSGMTVFVLLCTPQGFDLFGENPLVNFIAGVLIFLGTVPVASLGTIALWQWFVPARCSGCGGGVLLTFEGKRLVYPCPRCGDQL